MKTSSISLITLCGTLASFSPLPLAGQTAETQQIKSPSAETKTVSASKETKVPRLSAGLDDIVELARSGVDESVVLTFVQSSPVAYHPSAQEIIKLRELGVSTSVITAVLRRGAEAQQRAVQAAKEFQTAASTPAVNYQPSTPAVSTVQPATVYYAAPPAPTVVYASYPTYTYAVAPYYYSYRSCYYPRHYYYPRVSYQSCYYPRLSFGARFGGIHAGRFHGGFRSGIHRRW